MMGHDTHVDCLKLIWALVLMGLLAGCSGSSDGDDPPQDELSAALSISGSVGDGPIVDADISVADAGGSVVLTGTGDNTANYQLDVPDGVLMPVTVRASGGTDLVTGRAADFELVAVATASGAQTINISPLTTLAVRTAECSANGLGATSVRNGWNTIRGRFDMGLNGNLVSNPMTDPVTAANAETVVLANEALGEAVRRTQSALTSAGVPTSGDEVIRQLGCDLADGNLDAMGASVDARVVSTFRAVEAAVLLELIAGRLEVDDQDANALMDQSIRTVMPSFTNPNVRGVAVTQSVVDQAQAALAVLQGVYPDSELLTFATLLDSVSLAQARSSVDAQLGSTEQVVIDGLADRVANANSTEIDLLATRMQDQVLANPPIVSFAAANQSVVSGQSTTLSWAATNADQCFAAGGWMGPVALEGSFQTDPMTSATQFSMTCTGIGGTTTESVTVNITTTDPDPAPTLSLSAADSIVDSGGTTTLSWSTQNASSCTASNGWSGSKATAGSETVGPISANTTYTLTCSGSGGNAVALTTISVNGVIQLGWAAPTENVDGSVLTDLVRYRIYYGIQPGDYSDSVDVNDATATQHDLIVPMGTYYVAMKAFDADGNGSAYSNEVVKIPN